MVRPLQADQRWDVSGRVSSSTPFTIRRRRLSAWLRTAGEGRRVFRRAVPVHGAGLWSRAMCGSGEEAMIPPPAARAPARPLARLPGMPIMRSPRWRCRLESADATSGPGGRLRRRPALYRGRRRAASGLPVRRNAQSPEPGAGFGTPDDDADRASARSCGLRGVLHQSLARDATGHHLARGRRGARGRPDGAFRSAGERPGALDRRVPRSRTRPTPLP